MFITILIGMAICAAVGLTIALLYILGSSASDNPRQFVIGMIVVSIVLGMFYAVGLVGEMWRP